MPGSSSGVRITAERRKRIAEVYDSVVACHPRGVEVESLLQARDEAGSLLSPDNLRDHIRELSERSCEKCCGRRYAGHPNNST